MTKYLEPLPFVEIIDLKFDQAAGTERVEPLSSKKSRQKQTEVELSTSSASFPYFQKQDGADGAPKRAPHGFRRKKEADRLQHRPRATEETREDKRISKNKKLQDLKDFALSHLHAEEDAANRSTKSSRHASCCRRGQNFALLHCRCVIQTIREQNR